MRDLDYQQAIIERNIHPTGIYTPIDKAHDKTICECFAQIVAQYPQHIALRQGNRFIDYRTLDQFSNQVAHHILKIRGAQSEPIALCFLSDIDLLIGLLGILKAGKFFVLLDITDPKIVIQNLLANSTAMLIITNQAAFASTQLYADKTHIILNISELLSNNNTTAPNIQIPVNAPAVILYTSGSTGRPKGILKSHRAITYECGINVNEFHMSGGDVIGLFKRPTNSIAILFNSIFSGATLSFFDSLQQSPIATIDWLIRDRVTILNIPCAIFRDIAERIGAVKSQLQVRCISLTGEHTLPSDVALFQQHYPKTCVLRSGYGANEAWAATRYYFDHHSVTTQAILPAGFATLCTEIMIIDDDGRLCPSDVVGEIVIVRSIMADGYWQNEPISQAKFKLTDENPPRKCYYTGDMGYKRADGCLFVLGRKDYELKVFGHRVNVVEIENVIHQLEGIHTAIVTLFKEPESDAILIAYIQMQPNHRLDISYLRSRLSALLPPNSVPSRFIQIDRFPLNQSGKVDRKALPSPNAARPALPNDYVAPRSVDEMILAKIWSDVLKIPQIGVYDDFLDLGGHSLQAMRIISRVLQEFNVELTPQVLLQKKTIAEMALTITTKNASFVNSALIASMLDEIEASS